MAIFPVDEDSHPMKDGEGRNGGWEAFLLCWMVYNTRLEKCVEMFLLQRHIVVWHCYDINKTVAGMSAQKYTPG